MTDPRWQCLECGGMAYPTSELCPFCGVKRNAPAPKHGFLPPVDWKARHAATKAEREKENGA